MLTLLVFISSPVIAIAGELLQITPVAKPVQHGQVVTWDPRINVLYYSDFFAGCIYRYSPQTNSVSSICLNGTLAPIILSKNPNILIVGLSDSIVEVKWDGNTTSYEETTLASVSAIQPQSRFTNGVIDNSGRLWAGTFAITNKETETCVNNNNKTLACAIPHKGFLFTITSSNLNSPKIAVSHLNFSDGIAFNKDYTKLYNIDAIPSTLYQWDFNSETGEISNRKVLLQLENSIENSSEMYMDAMTVDIDGNLWVALFGGYAVIQIDPRSGKILKKVNVPAKQVAGVIWGGPNFDILYLGTANLGEDPVDNGKYAGRILEITGLGTKGHAPNYADFKQ